MVYEVDLSEMCDILLAPEAGDEHVPKRTFNAAFTAVCGHPVGADTKLTRCADLRITMAILLLISLENPL